MSGLWAACGLVLLALVLSATLKKDAPAIALLLTLAAGILLLLRAFSLADGALGRLTSLLEQGGMARELYLPVLKCVGVAVVVRVAGALCRDNGQGALAAKLEIAGAVLALALCLPLVEQVLALASGWAV